MERGLRDARNEAAIQSALEACSPANRVVYEAFLAHKHRRTGVGQRRHYATNLAAVDRATNGTVWSGWSADQLRAWTDSILARVGKGTSQQYALFVWAFLRHQYALIDRLPSNALRLALDVGPNEAEKRKRRISEADFLSLLGRHKYDLMYQAVLWTLSATGFRIGEALSLNLGSVDYHNDGVFLTIPPKDECRFRIKNKPRQVWVNECTHALKDWMGALFGGAKSTPNRLAIRDGLAWEPNEPLRRPCCATWDVGSPKRRMYRRFRKEVRGPGGRPYGIPWIGRCSPPGDFLDHGQHRVYPNEVDLPQR